METQESSTRRCIDCKMMICKEYYLKKDLWIGYCRTHRQTIYGYQRCHREKQYSTKSQKPKATQLAFDF